MKFNINITIVNPSDKKDKKKLEYVAEFSKIENTYGNGYYLYITNRDGSKNFEQAFDLRYNSNFSPASPEVFLAEYVYSNWSGANGSYDVSDLRIWKAR